MGENVVILQTLHFVFLAHVIQSLPLLVLCYLIVHLGSFSGLLLSPHQWSTITQLINIFRSLLELYLGGLFKDP